MSSQYHPWCLQSLWKDCHLSLWDFDKPFSLPITHFILPNTPKISSIMHLKYPSLPVFLLPLCCSFSQSLFLYLFFFLVIFITLISKLASRNLTGSRHRSFFFLLIPDLWWYLGFTVPPQSSPLLAFAFIFPIIQKLCGGLLPCINRHSENIRFVAFYILFIWNIFSYYNISKKMSTLCWMNMQKEDQVSGQYASSYFPNVPANTQHFAFPTM